MSTALVLEVGQRVASLVYGEGVVVEADNLPDGLYDEWGNVQPSFWKVEFDNEHPELEVDDWTNPSNLDKKYRYYNEDDLCPDGIYRDPRDEFNQEYLQDYWGEDYWMNASLYVVGPRPKRTSGFGKFISRIEGVDDD